MNVGFGYAMNIGFNQYIDDAARADIAVLQGASIVQASQIGVLEAGAVGPIVAANAVPPASLLSVVVPDGAISVIPLTGLGVISQPPGIWANVDGIIVGSNDIDSRLVFYLTMTVEDSTGGSALWQVGTVRGSLLASGTPVLAERSPFIPAKISTLVEPEGLAVVHTFTNPTSGPNFEYGIIAFHDGNAPRTLEIKSISYAGISIGPGF